MPGANLPALSARPATDGGDALIVAPISRFRIDPGRDAPRVVVSPAMPHHASLVLRRGRHAVPVLADLLIAGASGRLQIVVPGHGRPDIDIGLGTDSASQDQGYGKDRTFHYNLHRTVRTGHELVASDSCLVHQLTNLKDPAMPNGRCRMHGGKSTGAPKGNQNALKHGRYTRQAIASRREI